MDPGKPDIELVETANEIVLKMRAWTRRMKALDEIAGRKTRAMIYKQRGKFGKALVKFEEEVAELNEEFDSMGK